MRNPVALLSCILWAACAHANEAQDPYLWLEDVQGDTALEWVKAQNAKSLGALRAASTYQPLYDRALAIFDSRERIPMPSLRAGMVYNFWQDAEHPRGILRRATLASYQTTTPDWETVLDIDALSRAEDLLWVYKGSDCLAPEYRRCLIELSRGGADASEYREFDMVTREFIAGGIFIPEAKSGVAWKDQDTLWIGTNWGEGSLTESGYARIIKEWKRGTPLAEARTLFEMGPEQTGAWPAEYYSNGQRYNLVFERQTFFTGEVYLGTGDRLSRLDLPSDADFKTIFRDRVLFSLRSDWNTGGTTYVTGSLLAIDIDDLLQGHKNFAVLFTPSDRVSLDSVGTTRDRIIFTTLDNVKSRMYRVALANGDWKREEVALPGLGAAGIGATSDESDLFFYTYEDFLTPDALYLAEGGKTRQVKSLPAFFDAAGIEVRQHEATSADGTRIPYFLIGRKEALAAGDAPTLLYGYGGFEVSLTPSYSATLGASWLERGGVYALANIRGGGEFGPAWHQAAVQSKHMRNFEDFIGVAEHLITSKVTTPRHLGIMGGSQGGLLVGGTFVLRPDLFNAVVCQVPLLDMQRYNKLLAGASWMSEYGNPDKAEDWAYIQTWSPYQLVKKDASYPKVFFWTTTRDDRVHPGHARKMVAKMSDMGHPVYYYENIEGGHGAGSVNTQRAQVQALQYAYLWERLGD